MLCPGRIDRLLPRGSPPGPHVHPLECGGERAGEEDGEHKAEDPRRLTDVIGGSDASFAVTSAAPSIPSLCVRVVKIESRDAFRDATGELLISKSAVPEITDLLWDDDQVFVARDLSESPSSTSSVTRRSSRCVVRAPRRPCSSPGASTPTAESTCSTWPWATRSPRFAGPSSFAAWSPAACVCGPRSPPTAPQGSCAAIGSAFATSIRIRCWFHRLANIRSKLPDDDAAEVLAHIYAVPDAPTLDCTSAGGGSSPSSARSSLSWWRSMSLIETQARRGRMSDVDTAARPRRHVQRVNHERRGHRPRCLPADDAP